MRLDQFKFEKTKEQGCDEIAELTIGVDSKVILKKNGRFITVIKILKNVKVYKVAFNDETKLNKALKNIGKRK